jgi:hypothetical protein
MNGIEAFIVGRIQYLREELWTIEGRAFEDITIGDILSHDSESTNGNTKLEVISVSTYGREVTTLYKMMTGIIVVSSQQKCELDNFKMLYK